MQGVIMIYVRAQANEHKSSNQIEQDGIKGKTAEIHSFFFVFFQFNR